MDIVYRAKDGTIFETEEECLIHERTTGLSSTLIESFKNIINFCKNGHCDDCPFAVMNSSCALADNNPVDWEELFDGVDFNSTEQKVYTLFDSNAEPTVTVFKDKQEAMDDALHRLTEVYDREEMTYEEAKEKFLERHYYCNNCEDTLYIEETILN